MFDVPWLVQDVEQTSVEKYPVVNGFTPVITEADIDAYLKSGGPTNEGDPRKGFTADPQSMARVLRFLGWVAEYKSLTVDGPAVNARYYSEHFGYEQMLYAYHDTAEAIAAL